MRKIELTPRQERKFWTKVKKGAEGQCWEWQGIQLHNGYGRFGSSSRMMIAHRIAWTLLKGELNPHLVLNHLCRNRWCVNPDHLEEITNRENVLLGIGPTARNARKTECIRGHAFDAENTHYYQSKSGHVHRSCKECRRLYSQKMQEKLAA